MRRMALAANPQLPSPGLLNPSSRDEAHEGHPGPASPGTCFTCVPFKGSGDPQQLEHNQVSESTKQGHKNAIPRQNIIA